MGFFIVETKTNDLFVENFPTNFLRKVNQVFSFSISLINFPEIIPKLISTQNFEETLFAKPKNWAKTTPRKLAIDVLRTKTLGRNIANSSFCQNIPIRKLTRGRKSSFSTVRKHARHSLTTFSMPRMLTKGECFCTFLTRRLTTYRLLLY